MIWLLDSEIWYYCRGREKSMLGAIGHRGTQPEQSFTKDLSVTHILKLTHKKVNLRFSETLTAALFLDHRQGKRKATTTGERKRERERHTAIFVKPLLSIPTALAMENQSWYLATWRRKNLHAYDIWRARDLRSIILPAPVHHKGTLVPTAVLDQLVVTHIVSLCRLMCR